MILFFGPPGAGKSVQGQILAARHGWRWLSTGQLLRDTHDVELLKQMQTGGLIDTARINKVIQAAIERSKGIGHLIIDGFPRRLDQVEWLVESEPQHERSIEMAIVLEVPLSEIVRRIELRGRADDSPELAEKRMRIYRQEIYPILNFLNERKVPIVHLDGTGTVGQIHDRIESELEACSIV